MPTPSAADDRLAATYRRYAGGRTSPLQARLAVAVSGSGAALRALAALPARRRGPACVLAALHYLALTGRDPELAAAFASGDAAAAGERAVQALASSAETLAEVLATRGAPVAEPRPFGVLYPAIATAARLAGAEAVQLVHVGSPTGLATLVDRVRVAYANGPVLGDPASPVTARCRLVGERPVPTEPFPQVLGRVAVHGEPIDLASADAVTWLRASLAPDDAEGLARLDAELALVAATPPRTVRGDVLTALPAVLHAVPTGVLPVVFTTWTVSQLDAEGRARFVQVLDMMAVDGPVAWVSVEGVGVAPGVPTLGDRPASGHSIVGSSLFGLRPRTVAVGRCWQRGARMEWLGT